MKTKYQIFISSTYEDLKYERAEVVRAVLEMGHIPVGMEMFSAADEEQWGLIARQIDETDYYVLLVAHRYGSLDGEISYTEKEYNHAVLRGVPTLAFVIDDSAKWPGEFVDTNSESVERLKLFKSKVKKKLVSFWSSSDDLHGKVSIALIKQMNTNPRTGWVPASDVATPALAAELTRLSGENAILRAKIAESSVQEKEDAETEREALVQTLRKNNVEVAIWYQEADDWSHGLNKNYFQIFSLIAPEMLVEKSVQDLSSYVGLMFKNKKDQKPRVKWPVPSNSVKSWLADLSTLDLTRPSSRKHQVRDSNEYWTLTERGRDLYAHIRKARLFAGVNESQSAPENSQAPKDAGKAVKLSETQKKKK